jgi:hypothetical protein
MKICFLLLLLGLMSCQDASKKEDRPIEKVGQVEEDMGVEHESFVLQTSIEGLQLSGEKISKKGDLSIAENLKVIEGQSQKVIDEFPLFDWGPVGFTTTEKILKVFPVQNVLEIDYQVDDKKKVKRTPKCEFKSRPDKARFQTIISSAKSVNPDWESIISSISQLAYEGDKAAYDFFINPDKEAKAFLKNSDGAASIEPTLNVLKFMKANGCNW